MPLVIIWKPFRIIFSLFQRNWEIKTSLIDAFATFFLLSIVKFTGVSLNLLAPVRVYQFPLSNPFNYTVAWRLFYNANIPYLGSTHLPYAILGIAVLFFCLLLPTSLLILYPLNCFQKALNAIPFRWHILHTFMDSLQGHFKNGMEPGTRDCRWFTAVFILLRVALLLTGEITLSLSYFTIGATILMLTTILLIVIQPYKSSVAHYTTVNAVFLLLLAMFYVNLLGLYMTYRTQKSVFKLLLNISVLVGTFPLFYISVIILHWIFSHRKFGLTFIRRLNAWRQGYHWI